jgi:hypothetical protein
MLVTKWSASKEYRVDIQQTVIGSDGVNYHSAIVYKVIRSYFEPVLQGINILDSEINNYLEK